jgi:hypothetical protein
VSEMGKIETIHIENINEDTKMATLVLKNHNYAPFVFPSTVLKHPFK